MNIIGLLQIIIQGLKGLKSFQAMTLVCHSGTPIFLAAATETSGLKEKNKQTETHFNS